MRIICVVSHRRQCGRRRSLLAEFVAYARRPASARRYVTPIKLAGERHEDVATKRAHDSRSNFLMLLLLLFSSRRANV